MGACHHLLTGWNGTGHSPGRTRR